MAQALHPLKTWSQLDGPTGLPVAGNLFQIDLDTLHRTLEQWADRYGPLYRMRIGPVRIAVVSEPEAIKRMHRERPGRFRRTRKLEAVAAEMGLKGVFAAEGDDWLRQRKLVVRALNTAHLRSFFPKLAVIAARLQRRWEHAADARELVDLCRALMRLTRIVHHGRGVAALVFPEVIQNVESRRRPRADSAAPTALAGASHQAGADPGVAATVEMRCEHFVDEGLFGLTLDMDEEPGHRADSPPVHSRVGRPPSSFFSHNWPRL